MGELREAILERLRRQDTPDRFRRRQRLERDLHRQERELAEVRQQIPWWNRALFFLATDAEQREEALETELKQTRAQLEQVEEEIDHDLEQIGKEYPPFALGVAIERCFRQAEEELRVRGLLFKRVRNDQALIETVDALADRVLEIYLPDFEPDELQGILEDPRRCREAADRQVDPPRDDPHVGVAPVFGRTLTALVARRQLAGPYFAAREELARQRQTREDLARELEQVSAEVSWTDTLNVFTDSPAETKRRELRAQLGEADEQLFSASEELGRHLHDALEAYPPLAVYQGLLEVEGVLCLLHPEEELTLTRAGQVAKRHVVAPRALVHGAFRHLLEDFARVFPEVPLPLHAARELAPPPEPVDAEGARARLLADYFAELDAGPTASIRERALIHAQMRGGIDEALERTRGKISFLDRLVFWSDTEAEQREDELQRRVRWHAAASRAHWERLLKQARATAHAFTPLVVRDLAIEAAQAVDQIHTDSGESSYPRSCSVYGSGEALALLERLRELLGAGYGLHGDRQDMLTAVARCEDVGAPQAAGPFRPLPYARVVQLFARELSGTSFPEDFQALRETTYQRQETSYQHELVAQKVSFWDKLNVFTTTEDEAQAKQLKLQLKQLSGDEQAAARRVDTLFERATQVYPPARLYYALVRVEAAVRAISASCHSRTVTVGSGDNKRTETRYYCSLNGKGAAQKAMAGWAAQVVQVYGPLPGYHELLELWELRGLRDDGWDWDPWQE